MLLGCCRDNLTMRNIKLTFGFLLLILSALWLFADTFQPEPLTYFSFRSVFVQYTGVIGMGMMSVAMLLALRPKWLERPLKGLDKMYRLHKWLGITGLIFAVAHWWWAQGTKWMVGWGWLSRPERRKPTSTEALTQLEQWLRSQKGLAESLGEWAFYGAVIFIVLALIKLFPYRLFKKTHKWITLPYLVLVFHSLVLIKFEYWLQPIGWVMGALLVIGTVSAFLVLAGWPRYKDKVKGVVRSLTAYPSLRVIEVTIKLEGGWAGHSAGQFAFVTSKKSEGAHPYTIASAWNPEEQTLTFVVKQLGDWTGQLDQWLEEGMPVTVEGPYGCFDFNDNSSRQIWIGAGIGITPFIAKMKDLAQSSEHLQIDLFHVTSDYDQKAINKLIADAEAAKVRLHLTVTPKDGRLTPEQIRMLVPEWQSASLWFCGPRAFGDAVRKDFLANGLPATQYHQELFEMR